jgi:hypothetical protein
MDYSVTTLPRSQKLASDCFERIEAIMFKKGVTWKGSVSPDFTEGEV